MDTPWSEKQDGKECPAWRQESRGNSTGALLYTLVFLFFNCSEGDRVGLECAEDLTGSEETEEVGVGPAGLCEGGGEGQGAEEGPVSEVGDGEAVLGERERMQWAQDIENLGTIRASL